MPTTLRCQPAAPLDRHLRTTNHRPGRIRRPAAAERTRHPQHPAGRPHHDEPPMGPALHQLAEEMLERISADGSVEALLGPLTGDGSVADLSLLAGWLRTLLTERRGDAGTAAAGPDSRRTTTPSPRTLCEPQDGTALSAAPPFACLSDRERDIVKLVAEGCSYAQIAGTLFISQSTVSFHLGRIYAKVDVKSRHGLAALVQSQAAALGTAA